MSAPDNDIAESAGRYANQSQLILVAVVEFLTSPANLLVPKSQKDIQDGLSQTQTVTRDQVFRTLQNLSAVGWVELSGSGYVISPDLTRFADRLRHKLITLHRTYLEIGHHD